MTQFREDLKNTDPEYVKSQMGYTCNGCGEALNGLNISSTSFMCIRCALKNPLAMLETAEHPHGPPLSHFFPAEVPDVVFTISGTGSIEKFSLGIGVHEITVHAGKQIAEGKLVLEIPEGCDYELFRDSVEIPNSSFDPGLWKSFKPGDTIKVRVFPKIHSSLDQEHEYGTRTQKEYKELREQEAKKQKEREQAICAHEFEGMQCRHCGISERKFVIQQRSGFVDCPPYRDGLKSPARRLSLSEAVDLGTKQAMDILGTASQVMGGHSLRARIKKRDANGPTKELSDVKEFIVVDGMFYEKDWIKSAPGLRREQLDFIGAAKDG